MPRSKSKQRLCQVCGEPAKSARARYCISCAPRGKYRSRRTEVDGQVFDSRGEAHYWLKLLQDQKDRKISGLRRGRRYDIVINGEKVCSYTPDFEFVGPNGGWVVMDYKGFKTPIYRLKKKLMKAVLGIEITEVGPGASR